MELTNDPVMKDVIGTIKYLTTVAYNRGLHEGGQIDYIWIIY